MIAFLRAHWRKLTVVALLAVAFAVGRFTTPGPSVVEVAKVVTVEKRVEVEGKTKEKVVVVYREKTTKPDGTIVERETEKRETKTETERKTTDDKTAERETTITIEPYRPQWRAGALLGVNAGAVAAGGLSSGAFAWGAIAERRIAGPVWVGVWGLSAGPSFGVAVGVEF